MVFKQEVLDAFDILGLTPDTDQQSATKAYKKLALLHHPDRNHGDSTATQRFQQICAAWNICQRHYDNPSWSHVLDPSATYTFSKDDDIPLDEDELREFYMFMFAETLFNRYSRAKGQRYRYERSGRAGGGLSTFSGGFAESQERQAANAERQRKEREEYEKRKRELEREIEEEEHEREKLAKKLKADEDRLATAYDHAFQAAYTGNSSGVQKAILDHDLDVNAPRKRVKQARKQDEALQYETLLHVAASHCDEGLVMFLIERGAKPTALNKQQLTPFHAAIKAGNIHVVCFILERRGRSFEGYHPSKAALSGHTPLQLAIESGVPAMVEVLVKDATTHDVERCWRQQSTSEEVKEILRTKKGFVPPGEAIQQEPMLPSLSKKAHRQRDLAQQKEVRIAEGLERAASNRQKREERAAKRALMEQEQAVIKMAQEEKRRQAELEEHQHLEDIRRAQKEALAKELLETRLRAEAEARAQSVVEKHLREQQEAQTRHEQDRLEQARNRAEELNRPPVVEPPTPQVSPLSPRSNMRPVPPRGLLREEERKELRRIKLKEKRKAKKAQRIQEDRESLKVAQILVVSPQAESGPTQAKKTKFSKIGIKDIENMDDRQKGKYESAMRRRAEQSARDKERHRRMLEEGARTSARTQGETGRPEYGPLTPVSTHTTRNDASERLLNASPNTSFSPNMSSQPSLPSSFNRAVMPVEDIQTCLVPDDLFRDERAILRPSFESETFAQTALPFQPYVPASGRPRIVPPESVGTGRKLNLPSTL